MMEIPLRHIGRREFCLRFVSKTGLIIAFLFLFNLSSNGQVINQRIRGISLPDSIKVVDDSTLTAWNIYDCESVIFFCPKDQPKDTLEACMRELAESRFSESSAQAIFVSYKRDRLPRNNPRLVFFNDSSDVIDGVVVYVSSEDSLSLARSLMINNRMIDSAVRSDSVNNNIYRLQLNYIFCVKQLVNQIPAYYSFLNDLFSPQYTLEERLQMLEKRNAELENQIHVERVIYTDRINSLTNRLDSLQNQVEQLDPKRRRR